jgi:hypothetical protein
MVSPVGMTVSIGKYEVHLLGCAVLLERERCFMHGDVQTCEC